MGTTEAGRENGNGQVDIEYCVRCDYARCLGAFGNNWFYVRRDDCRAPIREVVCPSCASRIPLIKRRQLEQSQPGLQLLTQ